MNFGNFITFLYLIYEISFNLVIGQTINNEKNDCTKLYNFLRGDSIDYSVESCCNNVPGVVCDDEGYITIFTNYYMDVVVPDSKPFPYLPRIEQLNIFNNNLKDILNNITNLTSLKIIDIRGNSVEMIPPTIQNLSKLEQLYLDNNKIKELSDELFNLTNLKELTLRGNKIEVIPPAIQNLSNLEGLYMDSNYIKELPKEIFNLRHLKKFIIHNNPYLDTKMVKFGNTTIANCNFNTVNILCYEPHTCEKLYFNNRDFMDIDAGKYFKICTREEIDEILNINNKESKSSFLIIGGIILGCVVAILIGILATFMLIKKRKSKKQSKSDLNSNNENVKVVINENQNNNNNNNNNNAVAGIINNNKSDSNSNSNNNNNIQNNLNQTNLNSNVLLNSNDYSNNLTGMVILLNNHQIPGSPVTNCIPLFNNINQNNKNGSISFDNNPQISGSPVANFIPLFTNVNQNNKHGSISLDKKSQIPDSPVTNFIPLFNNINPNNKHGSISLNNSKARISVNTYSTLVDEEFDPPPEYSEINK